MHKFENHWAVEIWYWDHLPTPRGHCIQITWDSLQQVWNVAQEATFLTSFQVPLMPQASGVQLGSKITRHLQTKLEQAWLTCGGWRRIFGYNRKILDKALLTAPLEQPSSICHPWTFVGRQVEMATGCSSPGHPPRRGFKDRHTAKDKVKRDSLEHGSFSYTYKWYVYSQSSWRASVTTVRFSFLAGQLEILIVPG